MVNKVGWQIERLIERQGQGARPAWSAVERSPGEGNRLRQAAGAIERATQIMGGGGYD